MVRFGRTPALFKQHLLDAKRLLVRGASDSGKKAILIEAWNEWGEGSYIEPHSEFGFGYLDAIREVFAANETEHEDATPLDVGLGPYELPPSEYATRAWDLSRPEHSWNAAMNLIDSHTTNGYLTAQSSGTDPAFLSPGIRARASEYGLVALRMRLSAKGSTRQEDGAQLFWSSTRSSESEASSVRFPVRIDGEWHEYRVPVAQNPRWRGVITRLRLDPVNQSGVTVDLEKIALNRR